MTAPSGPQSPIRKQGPAGSGDAERVVKKRQPRGIEKTDPTPPEELVEPEIDPTDGIDLGDRVFADVIPGPPAPNTQPATPESKAAVAQEAVARRKAIRQGLRDRAASDRLFSGENAKLSPKQKSSLLSERHDQYAQLMALNCIKPLAQGIDASSLVEAVSSAAVMWALSPRFRQVMAEYNSKINETLRFTRAKRFEDTSRVPLGSNRAAVEVAETTAQREDKAMLDQVAAVLAGEEAVPFSTESAAMSLLQVHEDAYVALREGEDEDTVINALRETVDELTQTWTSQKLDPKLVVATARTLIGQTEDDEDLRLAQFAETADGSVRPSPQTVTTGTGGVAVASWGGQWSMASGGLLNNVDSPMFKVRPVQDARSHQNALSTLVFQDLELAAKSGPAELRKAVVGHWAAWDLREVKLDVSEVGGASRDRAAACAQRSRVAYTAMADDGIGENVRQTVAANALLVGMNEFEAAYPEAVALMVKEFGENHSEAAAQMVERGTERGRHVPVRPLVFNPSNPAHAAQMAGYTGPAPEPEQAREVAIESPRPSVVAPWGPRAHPDILAAERGDHHAAGEVSVPPRVAKVEQSAPVRRPVNKQEPQAGEAPERAPVPIWQLVSPKQNAERTARGFESVKRVPMGCTPVPADEAAYAREVAQRAELEDAADPSEPAAVHPAPTARPTPAGQQTRQSRPVTPGPQHGVAPAWLQSPTRETSVPTSPPAQRPQPRPAGVQAGSDRAGQHRVQRPDQPQNPQRVEGNTPRDPGRGGPELSA